MTAILGAFGPGGLDHLLVGVRRHAIHDEALEGAHRDRLAAGGAGATHRLAGVIAHARAGRGERVGAADDPIGFRVLAARDVRDVAPGFRAHRAGVLAGRAHQVLARARRAAPLEDMRFVFVAEPAQGRQHRIGRGLPQATQAGDLDGLGQFRQAHDALETNQRIDVLLLAPRPGDGVEDLQHAPRAFATGDALAAAFGLDELHEELGEVHHAGGLVQYHQAARAHDGAGALQGFVVDGRVEQLRRDAAARGTADLHSLELLACGRPAAHVEDHGAQRGAHGHLDQTRALDLPAEREDLGALAGGGADGGVALGALAHDYRDVGQGLDVVDDRGLGEQAALRRVGRPRPRHTAPAFDAVHERGFFAAHERAGAHLDVELQVEPAAHDVVADEAVGRGARDGLAQTLHRQRVFGANVDVGVFGADGVGGDHHAFQQLVRIALDQRAIHEGTRVTFVGVADQVLLVTGLGESHLPLAAGGKAAAAAAAQPALLDGVAHRFAGLAANGFQEALVSAARDVLLDAARIDDAREFQHPAKLRLEEGMLIQVGQVGPRLGRAGAELTHQVRGRESCRRTRRPGWRRRCRARPA